MCGVQTPGKSMTPLSPNPAAPSTPASVDNSAGLPAVPKLQPAPIPKSKAAEPAPAPPATTTPPEVPAPAPAPASKPVQPKSPKKEKEPTQPQQQQEPPAPPSPKVAKSPSPRPKSPIKAPPSPTRAPVNGDVNTGPGVSPRSLQPPSREPESEIVQPRPERLVRKIPEEDDEEQQRPSAPGSRPQRRSARPNGEQLPTDPEIG